MRFFKDGIHFDERIRLFPNILIKFYSIFKIFYRNARVSKDQ